jgi:mono/diheme cytochrome c family protein
MNAKRSLVLCGILAAGIGGFAQKRAEPKEGERLIESIQGPDLYKAYCAVCHGNNAKGSGPMAPSLKVPPPDLTRIAARNGGKYPFMKVQRIIAGEDAIQSGHGSREMPVWGPIFSVVAWDQDLGRVRIYNLTKYIEDLQTK